jgi:Vitamin K-dependent gamma-carboxylase
MMRAFVVSVYAWAAIAKARGDWLDGRTLALFHEEGRLRGPLADLLLASPGRCAVVGKLVFLAEASCCFLLGLPRTRLVGLVMATVFHLGIEWMGHPDVIGWLMLSLLLVFVPFEKERSARPWMAPAKPPPGLGRGERN